MQLMLRWYKIDDGPKIRNVPLSLTTGQYIYLDCPPMKKSAAEFLATGSYNKLKASKKGPFKIIQVSPTHVQLKKTEIGVPPIDPGTLEPSAKFSERHLLYLPDKPIANRDDEVDRGAGRATAKEFSDAPCEYGVEHVVGHVVMAIAFDTSYAGTATNQRKIW